MKHFFKIMMIMAVAASLWGCYEEPQPLDKPFVYIMDEAGSSSATISPNGALTSELFVSLSSKAVDFDTVVEYEIIVGDGIKEGVDFVVQSTTKSPITFKPGEYGPKPVRINWRKMSNYDASKNNTVIFRISQCSRSDVHIGYLGPDKFFSEYVFTRK